MSQEEYPAKFILDSIEAIMASAARPKVLLFDMGGVCVCSPFQAILDYEIENNIPLGWINHSISRSKPDGYWHRLERGETTIDATWFLNWSKDLHNPSHWMEFYTKTRTKNPSLPSTLPPLPKIDTETLFWSMISYSQEPDPWMYPALLALKKSDLFLLVALSNTLPLPEQSAHIFNRHSSFRSLFDIFISSADIGMRKPDPKIYKYTLDLINKFLRDDKSGKAEKLDWEGGVKAGEVLFLDDIGENLKGGKEAGFKTLKVNLGKTFEAVDQLEESTGLKLAGNHPRVPVPPGASGKKKAEAKL